MDKLEELGLQVSPEAATRCVLQEKEPLEISQNSQEKKTCPRVFFNKVAGLRPVTLFKKRLWHRCFSVNFVKFITTSFSQNTSWRLLVYSIDSACKVFPGS